MSYVSVFNEDVETNRGYRYTTNASYSSIVANERITRATLDFLGKGIHSILDVGCGDGTYTNEIHVARPDLDITGFDPAESAISVATGRFRDLVFFKGDILKPETFPKQKFDLAIVRGVIHHLSDPERAIHNLRRITDRILIIEPNGNNIILKIIEKASSYHRRHGEKSFFSRTLVRWCTEAGFRAMKTGYVGFVPFFLPAFPAKIIHSIQPWLEKIPVLPVLFAAQAVIYCDAGEKG